MGKKNIKKPIKKSKLKEISSQLQPKTYQKIINNINEGIIITDPKGIIISANNTFWKYLHLQDYKQYIGKGALSLLSKHFKAKGIGEVARLIPKLIKTSKTIKSMDLHLETKTGKKVDIEIIDSKIIENRITITTVRNISKRIQATEHARRSEELAEQIIIDMPIGILTLTKTGYVSACNPAFLKDSGYTGRHIIGKHFARLPIFSQDTASEFFKIFQEVLTKKKPVTYQFHWRHKDSSPRTGEAHISAIKNKTEISGIRIFILDVTDREEQLKNTESYSRKLENVSAIMHASNQSHSMDELLKSILSISIDLMGYDCGGVYLANWETRTANLEATQNLPVRFTRQFGELDITKEPCTTVFEKNEAIIQPDFHRHNTSLYKKYKLGSVISMPLSGGGLTLGALNLATLGRVVEFSSEDRRLLKAISNAIGAFIAKMQEKDELARKTRYESVSNQVSQLLSTSGSYKDMSRVIRQGLNLHNFTLGLLENDEKTFSITSTSSKISRVMESLIEKISIDLEQNVSACNYFAHLDAPTTITMEDLRVIVRGQGKAAKLSAKLVDPVFKKLMKTSLGELLIMPLITSNKMKIGAVLVGKMAGEIFSEKEIKLLSNLTRSLTIFIEKQHHASHIHFLAYHDELTTMPNFKQLKENLIQHISKKQKCTTIYLKFNNISEIISSRGDVLTDIYFKRAATVLHDAAMRINKNILIARQSGNAGFFVIFPDSNYSKITSFIERVIKILATPVFIEGKSIYSSVNAGFYRCVNFKSLDTELIIRYIKTALIESRKKGQNAYAEYDQDMASRYKKRIENEQAIMSDLYQGKGFTAYLQAKVDTDGLIEGYEALARWQVNGATISPGVFIPIIEEKSELIDKLCYNMLEDICRNIQHIQTDYPEISINISPIQFKNKELIPTLVKIISRYNLFNQRKKLIKPPFKLELIERAIFDPENIRVIKQLKKLGFDFAIDDFGTGQANYKTVRDLFRAEIISELKIDRTFIHGVRRDSRAEVIMLTHMIMPALSLGMEVVVEGVETVEEYEVLKSIDQRIKIQGFLFSKPIPAQAALKLGPRLEFIR